ncbi:DUF1905 domain-containing protein [Rathayibacter sp. KR2-224]|uniref:DUF1905 domain-containing protein n=1 Tax=Rathayibacter sp. KR2-224 TaxID=3400913 RepID=UPI003C0099A8
MAGIRYEFETTLFPWDARRELWVFARLPLDISEEIHDAPHPPAGFNSVKVEATLGSSRWSTSIFPESDGTFVLAIKKAIRMREGVDVGDTVRMAVETMV